MRQEDFTRTHLKINLEVMNKLLTFDMYKENGIVFDSINRASVIAIEMLKGQSKRHKCRGKHQ